MPQTPEQKQADVEMVAAVIRREPGAWQRFFAKHERLILACIRRVYRRYNVPLSPEEMEDLISATCLDLVRDDFGKLQRFDPDRGYRLSSWVGLIATNIAHDALRRRGPVLTSTDDEASPIGELPSGLPDPLEALAHKERVEILTRAVQRLTPADQEFVKLYYGAHLSPEEIARRTGVSVNTVYSRKHKVRGRLIRVVEAMLDSTPKGAP